MEKPIALQIEEVKKELIATINRSNLPAIILDYILKDIYHEIHLVNQSQLVSDMQTYEEAVKNKETEEESAK